MRDRDAKRSVEFDDLVTTNSQLLHILTNSLWLPSTASRLEPTTVLTLLSELNVDDSSLLALAPKLRKMADRDHKL